MPTKCVPIAPHVGRPFVVAVVAISLMLSAALVAPPRVAACSCMQLQPGQAQALADAVFIGSVVRVDDPTAGNPIVSTGDPVTYTFAVEETRKGLPLPQQQVTSSRDGASCGAGFTLGQRWVVYANAPSGERLHSGLCSGNELRGDAAPQPAPSAADPDGLGAGAALPVALVGLAALAAVAASAWALKRRDRARQG